MEEDVKLLENYCKALQGKHLDNRVRAIQNLLQAYKEDEAVIEEMAQSIHLLPNFDSKSAENVIRMFRNKVKGDKK